MNSPEDLARQRFMILNLVRFGAIAFVFAGAANVVMPSAIAYPIRCLNT